MAALDRFVMAQQNVFEAALGELLDGHKTSHWMWFVFPQIAGLGHSDMARRYAVGDLAEAQAYLVHPLLGERLQAAVDAMMRWAGVRTATQVLGGIDAVKLRSCLTLFEAAGARFCTPALDAFYAGERDPETLRRLVPRG